MAQGKLKIKAKLPVGVKPRSNQFKKEKIHRRKGLRYIAPKKRKVIENEKQQKNLQQCIQARIEEEMTQRAINSGNTLKVVGKGLSSDATDNKK